MQRAADQLSVLVANLAAFGLPGSRLPVGGIDTERRSALIVRVKQARMEGLLVAATDAGEFSLQDAWVERVRQLGRARARIDLELEREALRAVTALEAAGVEYRLLKGPALAHTVYPDPMWRGFGDIDLLLPLDGWREAVMALESSGARRVTPEIRPNFDVRFGKDATLLSEAGWEIDLHSRLVLGPYGFWAESERIFTNMPASIRLGGQKVAVLQMEDAFVYACCSAALADDPPRLVSLRDVAQIAFNEGLDVERVVDIAARWNARDVVARALSLAQRHIGVPLSETAVGQRFGGVRLRSRHRILMASYRGPARGYTSQLAGVVALQGIKTKAAYLAALARPQDDYLSARGFSRSGFLVQAGRRVWSHR